MVTPKILDDTDRSTFFGYGYNPAKAQLISTTTKPLMIWN
jgi:hypothetical protein